MTAQAFGLIESLTFATIEHERARFLAYCSNNQGELVVDLGKTTRCDSAGLAFLIEVKRLGTVQGRLSQIINMPQEIRALAEFYGINNLLLELVD